MTIKHKRLALLRSIDALTAKVAGLTIKHKRLALLRSIDALTAKVAGFGKIVL